MSDKINITVTGTSDPGDGMTDVTVTKATGTYAVHGGKLVICYEETDEESGQLLKTIIRFDENNAEVTRKGTIESKLVFISGGKSETVYATPYGSFQMATITKTLKKEETDKKINLHIDYDMEINDSFASKNSIAIEIEII